MNFWGPETARWGGGLPREGVVAEKFVPFLKSLSSLGFKEESGMSREFCRDIPVPWGCSKISKAPDMFNFLRHVMTAILSV